MSASASKMDIFIDVAIGALARCWICGTSCEVVVYHAYNGCMKESFHSAMNFTAKIFKRLSPSNRPPTM